jgi:N-succinyldiaminopimelate aminotransferase
MLNDRLTQLADYPFTRLANLLNTAEPGGEPLIMSIGEPQHEAPPLVGQVLAEAGRQWGKYPPIAGTPDFRQAVKEWLNRRYILPEELLDADKQILPVAGTREALFQAALLTVPEAKTGKKPVVLIPNPFYQVYLGGALMAGAEPVLVSAGRETGFLPDYSSLPSEILERTVLAFICSPANPQGAVADKEYLRRTLALARRHNFVLAADECYSEIYDNVPPAGLLELCAEDGGSLDNVMIFNSLSKRSSVPGLRSGFVAGDVRLISAFNRLRSYGGAAVPLPILAVSAALWRDEAHVDNNRAMYRVKIDIAERIMGKKFGFFRPPGGFFLWLDVGDGEQAALKIWRKTGIRVLPGAYLAREGADGVNPGRSYIRVALVHDTETSRRALEQISAALATG